MRIVVVGAYGLLGGYVTARLLRDGHAIVGVGRDIRVARRRFPTVDWVSLDLRTATAADWRALVRGAEAVVNCAGALQDSPRDDLEAVHTRAVLALAEACEDEGVRRLVHISAAGIERVGTPFGETKRAAEDALRLAGLDWVILRPGLLLAPAAYGGSALLRGLAAFPDLIPLLKPEQVIQTVSADDVAEAVARCLGLEAPARVAIDLVADEETSLEDIVLALRGWLGLAPAPVVTAPPWMGGVAARVADGLGRLGWRSPMRRAAIDQLSVGVQGRAADAVEHLGFAVRTLPQSLAAWPSGVQERWFARLYFLKPLILAALALFWAASGIVGLIQLREAASLLAAWPPPVAKAIVVVGSLADIALAVLVCVRRTAPAALLGMITLTFGYLAAATILTPALWADPLGPLVKSLPAAMLALVALATLEER